MIFLSGNSINFAEKYLVIQLENLIHSCTLAFDNCECTTEA